jgi:hypothetical protein
MAANVVRERLDRRVAKPGLLAQRHEHDRVEVAAESPAQMVFAVDPRGGHAVGLEPAPARRRLVGVAAPAHRRARRLGVERANGVRHVERVTA